MIKSNSDVYKRYLQESRLPFVQAAFCFREKEKSNSRFSRKMAEKPENLDIVKQQQKNDEYTTVMLEKSSQLWYHSCIIRVIPDAEFNALRRK